MSFFPVKLKSSKHQSQELSDTFSLQEMTIEESDDSGLSQNLELLPPRSSRTFHRVFDKCFCCFGYRRKWFKWDLKKDYVFDRRTIIRWIESKDNEFEYKLSFSKNIFAKQIWVCVLDWLYLAICYIIWLCIKGCKQAGFQEKWIWKISVFGLKSSNDVFYFK